MLSEGSVRFCPTEYLGLSPEQGQLLLGNGSEAETCNLGSDTSPLRAK